MKDAPVRHRIEQIAYLALKGWLRALPHEGARVFGRGIGLLAWMLDGVDIDSQLMDAEKCRVAVFAGENLATEGPARRRSAEIRMPWPVDPLEQ